MKHNSQDPIKAFARKQSAKRRVGSNAKCECGQSNPEILIKKFVCPDCDRKAQGKTPYDKHHIAGKNNSPTTVTIPVNDHRAELSTAQYEWPKRTLENGHGSPLIAAAGCLRGFIDFIHYLVKKLLGWIPPFLEAVDECLVNLFGSHWWSSLEFKSLLSELIYAQP